MTTMDKFKKDIIDEFWKWVTEHQDNETVVDHDGEGNLCIWIDFSDLEDFAERYITDVEDSLQTALFNGHVCVEVNDFLGGHGFTMDNVWEHRPSCLVD